MMGKKLDNVGPGMRLVSVGNASIPSLPLYVVVSAHVRWNKNDAFEYMCVLEREREREERERERQLVYKRSQINGCASVGQCDQI